MAGKYSENKEDDKIVEESIIEHIQQVALELQKSLHETINEQDKNTHTYDFSDSLVSKLNEDQSGKYSQADEINLEAEHAQNLDKSNVILASDVSFNAPVEELDEKSPQQKLVQQQSQLVKLVDELNLDFDFEMKDGVAQSADSYDGIIEKIGSLSINDAENQGKRVYTEVDEQKELIHNYRNAKAAQTNKNTLNEDELAIEKVDRS